MRLLVAALLTLAGCSSPAPRDEDPAPWRYTRDSAVEQAEDDAPGPLFDAADTAAPDTADTYTPPPDTYTAPPDTYVCRPKSPADVCTFRTTPFAPACGTRPDGCGGTVNCNPCPDARRLCATGSDGVTFCSCDIVIGVLCLDRTGVYVQQYQCGPLDVPVNPDAVFMPNPKATRSLWCVPA